MRNSSTQPMPSPPVLPQIIAEIVSPEHVVLTVNGQRLQTSPASRSELGRVIGELVDRLGTRTRVEVHELDGNVWADILTPRRPTVTDAESQRTPAPDLVELTSDGFVPGEDVAIALVLRHTSATGHGTARALIDRAETATVTGEVILLGRISGTTSIQRTD